jgi:hypothetical protein
MWEKTVSTDVRMALEKAIERAEKRVIQFETTGFLDPSSKADMAIKKLLEDRILPLEELHRSTTI